MKLTRLGDSVLRTLSTHSRVLRAVGIESAGSAVSAVPVESSRAAARRAAVNRCAPARATETWGHWLELSGSFWGGVLEISFVH